MSATDLNASALGKVAVLMGGSSAEREISLMSGPPCAHKALTRMHSIRPSGL